MRRDDRTDEAVVVPESGTPSTIACLRSLGAEGVHTIVVSEDRTAPGFASKYCDEAVWAPCPDEDLAGYAEALLALARRADVRTIVPVREEDAFVLAKHREAFAEHVATPWPSLEGLERVHDRVQLAEAAAAAGVPYPRTTPLREVDDWSEPAIVKSRYNLLVDEYVDGIPTGRTGRNKDIRYLEPGEVPDVEALCEAFDHEPIVQEFVPVDEEYMVGALYGDGEPLATFQHHQIRGTSYANGGGVYRRSVADPGLEEVATRLLEHLDWHGLACIEYMRDPSTGAYKLAEINPRMWQSLSANVRMGADFPRYYWLAATGAVDRIDPEYDVGVECQYLIGELSYLASIFTDESPFVERPSFSAALREVAATCLRNRTFDVLERDDPWPFVAGLVEIADQRLPEPVAVGRLVRRLAGADAPTKWGGSPAQQIGRPRSALAGSVNER